MQPGESGLILNLNLNFKNQIKVWIMIALLHLWQDNLEK